MSPLRILIGLTIGALFLTAGLAAVWYWELPPLTVPITLFALAAILAGLLAEFRRRAALRQYWNRACTGSFWRRRFPEASKADIGAFLDAFLDAFAFPNRRRLSFSPDDRVLDIYHALYPPNEGLADSLELEDFAGRLQRTYHFDLPRAWRADITLGELYAQIHQEGRTIKAVAAARNEPPTTAIG